MVKPLVNIHLSYEVHRTLEQMVLAPGETKSAIIEDALHACLDPSCAGGRVMPRLDKFDERQNAI